MTSVSFFQVDPCIADPCRPLGKHVELAGNGMLFIKGSASV